MRLLALLLFFVSFTISAETDFEKAERLYRMQQYEQAKTLFESVLKSNPNDYKAIEYLGDIAAHQKQWDVALSRYQFLRARWPQSANYHYKTGAAMAMEAKEANIFKAYALVDDIESTFLTAARLDPKHIDTRWALVIFYLELPALIGGSEKKAQQYANELLAISKIDGLLAKGYIETYFKRYQKAEGYYLQAHQLGHSKTTFGKLYDLYQNKLKNTYKAQQLKEAYTKSL